jgi:ribosomal protein L34
VSDEVRPVLTRRRSRGRAGPSAGRARDKSIRAFTNTSGWERRLGSNGNENATTNGRNVREEIRSKGRTALLDAVYLALHEMKKAKNPRKALLITSDGGDNSSRYTEGEIKNLVKEADVQVYAIGIYEPIESRSRTPEELAGPGLLTEIA